MGTLIEKVKIEIDGNEYKDYNFLNIVLKQELLKPNELCFKLQKKSLSESMENNTFPVPKEVIGAEIVCEIETKRFDENTDELLTDTESITFKGIVFSVNVYTSSDTFSQQLIDVRAFSHDYLLTDHPHCFSYENENLKKIITATLDPYQIPNEINPRTTDSIPYTVQYNETNYQFLSRLAKHYGEWMYNDGVKWFFGKVNKKDTVQLKARNDVLKYHFRTGLVHHKVKHAHHDYLKYENPIKSDADFPDLTSSGYHLLTDEAKDKSGKWFTKETFQQLRCSNPEDNDIDELEVSAKAQLFGEKTQQVVCTGSSIRSDLTIGSRIQIWDHFYDDDKNHKSMSFEELMITSIVHYTEVSGNYHNSFSAVPASSEYPPYYQSDIYPVAAVQRAKVMDNNDPEKLGRIRVQFLWQEAQNPDLMTPWIRIAQPHGGDDKGFYFIPEIDEEVMVDFENANAEKPFVVGTLYHGKQLPGHKWPTESNDIKAIRTRNGHTIEIHDEGKDGFIRIYDHEKENYILTFSTDEKLIKLESTGNIELYAENDIILDAKNNIIQKAKKNRLSTIGEVDDVSTKSHNYKAKNNIYIEGESYFVTGKDKAVIDSGNLAQIQSDSTANVLGNSSVLVGSSSEVEISAGTTMKVEAEATMNIKAGAPMTIKGAVVNIN